MNVKDRLAELVTVKNFRAWLVTKDPDETFNYGDNHACVVAQFVKSFPEFQGREVGVGDDYVRVDGPCDYDRNALVLPLLIHKAAHAAPSTFGNVLRALDLLKEPT